MDTLQYFVEKYNLNLNQNSPIEIQKINRPLMAQNMAELGFKVGAEVGVAAGDHSEILLQNIPNLKLYCIDAWANVDGFLQFRGSTLRNWEMEARKKLEKYNNCTIIKKVSMEAVRDFKDQTLDFVYIDAAHDFRHIAEDISEWIKRVRPGGILYGHDYTTIPSGRHLCHVKDVVDAYAVSHNIDTWFVLGMVGLPDGMYRQSERAWMYIL